MYECKLSAYQGSTLLAIINPFLRTNPGD